MNRFRQHLPGDSHDFISIWNYPAWRYCHVCGEIRNEANVVIRRSVSAR